MTPVPKSQVCFDCGAPWHPHMRRRDHLPTCKRNIACPGCGQFPTVKTGEERHFSFCPRIRTFDERTATPEQLANSTNTCEACDEPLHIGHCDDPFLCACTDAVCEDARRRYLVRAGVAIPGLTPKEEPSGD